MIQDKNLSNTFVTEYLNRYSTFSLTSKDAVVKEFKSNVLSKLDVDMVFIYKFLRNKNYSAQVFVSRKRNIKGYEFYPHKVLAYFKLDGVICFIHLYYKKLGAAKTADINIYLQEKDLKTIAQTRGVYLKKSDPSLTKEGYAKLKDFYPLDEYEKRAKEEKGVLVFSTEQLPFIYNFVIKTSGAKIKGSPIQLGPSKVVEGVPFKMGIFLVLFD